MKNILISSFDMEVGGVERSLISMLDNFDYNNYSIDLMLYRQIGEFLALVSNKVRLIDEISQYSTFRKSIGEILIDKQFGIGISRLQAKINAALIGKVKGIKDPSCFQMQLMWKYTLPLLPKIAKEYDVAISYLWPHYFVADKVKAKKKIAWIHTDFSIVETDIKLDLKMWNNFDYIVAVSEACKTSFLNKYRELANKVIVIENITSPEFIKEKADEGVNNPLLNDKRFRIVTVSRLSHAKGIDNAIRALKKLKEKGYNNIAWYVVGYGDDEKALKSLIKEFNLEDSFILLGKITNPYPYMKEADLYVQPSRYEGKAVTVGEAQILSKPVLITNYATANSQVNDGIDGYITELSVDGIIKGIEILYKDSKLRNSLIDNCKKKDFSNSYEIEKLYDIIN